MLFLAKFLVYSMIFYVAGEFLSGIHLDHWSTAMLGAISLLIVNFLIRPILVLLTLPLTILTLGLFVYIINTLMILLVDKLIPGFAVDNFGWALLLALMLNVFDRIIFNSNDRITPKKDKKSRKKSNSSINQDDDIIDVEYEEVDK